MRSALGLSLLVLGVSFTVGCPTPQTPLTSVTSVSPEKEAARYYSAVMLSSNQVLVTGGLSSISPSIDVTSGTSTLYEPKTDKWTLTGDLNEPRYRASAVTLKTGEVLLSGGMSFYQGVLGTAELYENGTWQLIDSPLSQPRYGHQSTLLRSGKVLVTGGYTLIADPPLGQGGGATTAELYDPSTKRWSSAGDLGHSSLDATATLLNSGEVLLLGSKGVDIYNPESNTWSHRETLPFVARGYHAATLLDSGAVLVTGGINKGRSNSTALYDPSTDTWVEGPPMNQPHSHHTATQLSSGKVLILGSVGGTELYDPTAKLDDDSTPPWTQLEDPPGTHIMATAFFLHNDQVLITGGTAASTSVAIFTAPH